MQENGNNNQPPEGIDILINEADGKIYVINEVLNYYQIKLRVLTKQQVLSLTHHVFNEEMIEAGLGCISNQILKLVQTQ